MSISRINFYLAVLLAFTMPINRIVSTYIIVFWTITWIIERIKKTPHNQIENKYKLILFSLIILYILNIIGLLNTSNLHNGLIALRIKLPLLIFPILFLFQNRFYKKFYRFILLAFISGTFLTLMFLYIRATYLYLIYHKIAFSYTYFSFVYHPSYFSMYIVFSVVSLIYLYEKYFNHKKYLLPVILVSLFFLEGIYCLSSRTNLISTFLIIIILTIIKLYKKHKIWLVVLTAIIVVSFYLTIQNNIRYSDLFHQNLKSFHNIKKDTKSSTSVRIYVIKTAWKLFKENPLGYGTGDVKDALMEKYSKDGITSALEKKLNTHNQYFETAIGLGVQGAFLLFFILFFPFFIALKNKNYLYFLFLLLIMINFSSESMLNRQNGVVFFSFFILLLAIYQIPRSKIVSKDD